MSRTPGPAREGRAGQPPRPRSGSRSPCLCQQQPGSAAASSQLRWGAKFTLKLPRRAVGAVSTRPGLAGRGAELPPCTMQARSEGAAPQNSAARCSPHPRPAPGARSPPQLERRSSRAASAPDARRRVSLALRPPPPPPARDPQPRIPGAQDTQPQRSLVLPENSEPPAADAWVRVSQEPCESVCAPGALHALGSAGGET